MNKQNTDYTIKEIVIQNTDGQRIVVSLYIPQIVKGIALCVHGLGSSQQSTYIQLLKDACLSQSLLVITFDCRNSFGKSDGSFEKASATSFIEDVQTVRHWMKKQEWYIPKVFLFGHSLGGLAILETYKHDPLDIIGLVPLATVISGTLSCQSPRYTAQVLDDWKKTGYLTFEKDELLPWSHMEDRLQYDSLTYANTISCETLLIVGELDKSTPVNHQRMLLQAIPNTAELHVIANMGHSPSTKDTKTNAEIQVIVESWIGKIVMRNI